MSKKAMIENNIHKSHDNYVIRVKRYFIIISTVIISLPLLLFAILVSYGEISYCIRVKPIIQSLSNQCPIGIHIDDVILEDAILIDTIQGPINASMLLIDRNDPSRDLLEGENMYIYYRLYGIYRGWWISRCRCNTNR